MPRGDKRTKKTKQNKTKKEREKTFGNLRIANQLVSTRQEDEGKECPVGHVYLLKYCSFNCSFGRRCGKWKDIRIACIVEGNKLSELSFDNDEHALENANASMLSSLTWEGREGDGKTDS